QGTVGREGSQDVGSGLVKDSVYPPCVVLWQWGFLHAGGALNWERLEPWFALGPAVLHIPLGILAWQVIRHRYTPKSVAR
ncbi:MAG: hypothetical protein P8M13_03390, partial [Luminiphilus sp.]|nr:hypothetical protein [Luminiphilus sp.]